MRDETPGILPYKGKKGTYGPKGYHDGFLGFCLKQGIKLINKKEKVLDDAQHLKNRKLLKEL